LDAGFGSGGAFHGLEVDGQVVDECEEGGAEEEGERHGEDDVAVFEKTWGERAAFASAQLREDEEDYETTGADEEADDA